jgi:RecA/RadA recombinase
MDGRNSQQRKRRAQMTDEQREENKKRHREYQSQYRARKKAELQNNSTTAFLNQDGAKIIVPTSSPTGEKCLSPYAFRPPSDIS